MNRRFFLFTSTRQQHRSLSRMFVRAALFLFCVSIVTASEPVRTREAVTINRGWTFNYFPDQKMSNGCEAAAFDDARWQEVALPHTWSTYETTGELHPYIRNPAEKDDPYWWTGWGWYRQRFTVGREHADRKVFVEFDGVQKYCKVWLNGELVGEHKGGFASFSLDLTQKLRFGSENVLAVAVNNARIDPFAIPPMAAGNWDVYGGIYRDVRIVVKDKLHIPFQGSVESEGGTFITTPEVSAARATVRVRTWVKNDAAEAQDCTLRTQIRDPEGTILQQLEAREVIAAGALHEFDQTSKPIPQPRLWWPANGIQRDGKNLSPQPGAEGSAVYSVSSVVMREGGEVDACTSPLGFRWFRWEHAENRLYLNDQLVKIHGTNRHQEYPWLGDAMPKWMHEMDLRDIRFGLYHNFLRTAHYTQDRMVYDFCDRNGIIVCEEVPNIKNQDFSRTVQEQQVKEMIRRDRNHPSILFWSVGNETNNAADSAWVVSEDKSRIVHARHVAGPSSGAFVSHTDAQMDMENLLRCTIRGWYSKDEKDLEPRDAQATGNETFQHQMAMVQDGSLRGRIDMPNGVMWLYEDHGADREYVNCPLKHVNPKGWVDSYRFPKYLYHLWQANYAPEPVAFIQPHFWRPQYVGQKKDIVVDSNCDAVELLVNGHSLATLAPSPANFHSVTFEGVTVEHGTVSVRGKKGDRTIESAVTMPGPAARLVLTSSHEKFPAALDSVAILKTSVVDAAGEPVVGFNGTLRWSVDGPATLVGPATYESDINKDGALEGTMYIDTPVANVIRSTGKPGRITVRVSSGTLAAGEVKVIAEPLQEPAVAGVTQKPLPAGPRQRVAQNPAGRHGDAEKAGTTAEADRPFPDLQWGPLPPEEFRRRAAELLRNRHPEITPGTPRWRALVESLTRHLIDNKGVLIRDDFNFIISREQ